MFHLINSVYVNLDSYMDRIHPHYNISQCSGYRLVLEDGVTIADDDNTQIDFTPSLSELGDSRFRKWLTDMRDRKSGRVMVWADPVSYMSLAAAQLMAMVPDMDKEQLSYFLMMVSVELDSSRIANGVAIRHDEKVLDIKGNIHAIHRDASRLAPIMRAVLYNDPKARSLEWRVAEYVTTGVALEIAPLLRRILIRATVMTCFEALFEVKHLIGDRSTWETLGCTTESLLSAPNAFAGMTAFNRINSQWMLSLDPHDHSVDLEDLEEAAAEARVIFTLADDDRKVRSLDEQLEALRGMESGDLDELDVLRLMFGTRVHGARPCDRDCSKYNSVIISHFLSQAE